MNSKGFKPYLILVMVFFICFIGAQWHYSSETEKGLAQQEIKTNVSYSLEINENKENWSFDEKSFFVQDISGPFSNITENLVVEVPGSNTEYSIETNGSNIISSETSLEGNLNLEIYPVNNQSEIKICSTADNGMEQEEYIFTYVKDDIIFSSPYSIEDARFNSVIYDYKQGLISKKEYEEAYSIYSRRDIVEDISVVKYAEKQKTSTIGGESRATTDTTTYVQGTIKWNASSSNIERPLQFMRIDLYDYDAISDNEWIASTYTDINGYYSFSFSNDESIWDLDGSDIFIKVYPDGGTFEIGSNWNTTQNYYVYTSSIYRGVETGDTITIDANIAYNPNNMTNCAFSIAQGLIVSEKHYLASTNNRPTTMLKVWFPVVPAGVTQFLEWVNAQFNHAIDKVLVAADELAFCYRYLMGLGRGNFDEWDVVMHEYGHFVEHNMQTYGINLIEHCLYNPRHHWGDDAISAHDNNKRYGTELAWSEAWATVFSIISQHYYIENYDSSILNIYGAGDNNYTGWDLENMDLNLYQNNVMIGGEADEYALIHLIWDIYDNSGTNETFDVMSSTIQIWWTLTTQPMAYTLSDVVQTIDETYFVYRDSLGKLLEYYKVAPQNLIVNFISVNNNILTSSSSIWIGWDAGGNHTSKNSSYEVRVCNSSGTILWQSGIIDFEFLIIAGQGLKEIRNLLSRQNTTLYLCVVGFNNGSTSTGPYMTGLRSFSLINPLELDNATPYAELKGSSAAGTWKSFYIYFKNPGNKIVQTFGPRNSKIELQDANGTILATDNDSGFDNNALISFNSTANTLYKVRIRYNSFFTAGAFRLAIMAGPEISNYEGLTSISNSYSQKENPMQYQAAIYRYYTDVTSVRTFSTSSAGLDVDTQLFIVDPSSANLIGQSDYNDNHASTYFSQISKNITTSDSYLIIASSKTLATIKAFNLNIM